jgi:hypothetical protein
LGLITETNNKLGISNPIYTEVITRILNVSSLYSTETQILAGIYMKQEIVSGKTVTLVGL